MFTKLQSLFWKDTYVVLCVNLKQPGKLNFELCVAITTYEKLFIQLVVSLTGVFFV